MSRVHAAHAPTVPRPFLHLPTKVQFRESMARLAKKCGEIAIIALKVLATAFCYWANPTIFTVSFILGICFGKQVREIVDKVKLVLKYHTWPALSLCGVMAFIAWPVCLAAATALWSAHLGERFYNSALQNSKKPEAIKKHG